MRGLNSGYFPIILHANIQLATIGIGKGNDFFHDNRFANRFAIALKFNR